MGMLLVTASWGAEEKGSKSEPKKNPIVVMETNFGTLEIELLFDAAPNTAKNFLDLVNKKFYNGLTFHRIVPDFVIQGGDPKGDGTGGPGYSIKDEKSTQAEVRGTLGMAKSGPNTAGSQFYINLKDNTRLDGMGFCGFAKVVKGMEVADKISMLPRIGETPKEKVTIIKAYIKNTAPQVKTDKK
jgi:cyclophilin family peptidyl-prolyl cis-trans isomerase